MEKFSHDRQQQIWEEEHKTPRVLLQMDSNEPSSGVILFKEWLNQHDSRDFLKGFEMGCGKGRNVIWLALQGYNAYGLDFSYNAINEARRRANLAQVNLEARFTRTDATTRWPFLDDDFEFGIDCFASTDIETPQGRKKAVAQMHRVMKPGGYMMVYSLSPEDEFHKEQISQYQQSNPNAEPNSFQHESTGKFEKVFTEKELINLYKPFDLVEKRRIAKKATFDGVDYDCLHHWMVFRKAN